MRTNEYVFNHKDDFVTAKVFRASGKQYTGGQPFDKESVSPRRLRSMYETGFIRPVKKEVEVEEVPVENNEPVSEVSENGEGSEIAEQSQPVEVLEEVETVTEEVPADSTEEKKGKKGKK